MQTLSSCHVVVSCDKIIRSAVLSESDLVGGLVGVIKHASESREPATLTQC